jgi:hypothetical protein
MQRQRLDMFKCDVCGCDRTIVVPDAAGPNDVMFPTGWRQVKLTAPNVHNRERLDYLCCSDCVCGVMLALTNRPTHESPI